MTRDEFMKELAYLLQDIQDEDKDDAVQYYTDYFEEAGPDKEAEVIQELGSPERIAAIIRADIAGHLESGGEFTEQGYQDERFRDPGYAMAKRLDLPEEQENGAREGAAGDRAITGNRTLTGNRALTGNAALTRSRVLTMGRVRLIQKGTMELPIPLPPGPVR